MTRHIYLLAFLCVWLAACSATKDNDEFNEIVLTVLDENYGATIRQNCTFSFDVYHRLYRKPEFTDLRDKEICDGRFMIETLEIFADDSVRVDFRIGYEADRSFVRQFLRGWNRLTERYEQLDSLRIPDPRHGFVWTYTDPYDQDIFIRSPEDPAGVFSTQRWEQLETVKNWFQNLSDNRYVYSDSYSVVMVERDYWKIVTEDVVSGYSEDIRR